jgi:hypothetical protein
MKESLRDQFLLPSNPLQLRSHPACSAFAHQIGKIKFTQNSHRNGLSQNRLQDFHLNSAPRQQRRPKVVDSRRSLACLEQIAREHHASRDALVEFSVQRLLPLIKQEQEMLVKRKAVLKEYDRYVADGKKLLDKAKKFLGDDDPVVEELESVVAVSENTLQKIDSYLEKGKVIEQF